MVSFGEEVLKSWSSFMFYLVVYRYESRYLDKKLEGKEISNSTA